MRRCCTTAALIGALSTSACGPTYIVIEIDSDLAIPAEIDRLELLLYEPDDGAELLDVEIDLDESQAFPIEVGVIPSPDTPQPLLEAYVTGLLDGAEVAEMAARFDWLSDTTNRVELEPLRPLP